MTRRLKTYGLCLLVYVGCDCSPSTEVSTIPIPANSYHNLEIIDLGLQGSGDFSFEFNGTKLAKNGDLYVSPDLIVYQPQHPDKQDNKKSKWCATVIGPGGVASKLKVSKEGKLIQEVEITTTKEVVQYQEISGPEWPGMVNRRNACFANAIYKLMARCAGP